MTNTTNTTGSEFVLTKELNAPRELVWAVWNEPAHLQRWFGPKGVTMPTCNMDFRPGGIFHYSMRTPDGNEMWGKWVFREIVAPERLVLISSFSDATGNKTRHPLAATWPLETLSTTTYEARGNKTLMTLRWRAYNATPEEQQTFDGAHDNMRQGWAGTMEQLENYLATLI